MPESSDSLRVAQVYTEFDTKGLSSTEKSINSLRGKLNSVRNVLAGIVGAFTLKSVAGSFVAAAKSAEDYRTSIRAVSNSIEEADAAFDRVRKWAAVNPVDTDEAVGAFVRLRTAAVANAEEALNAIADVSTVMHADMRDVASAVVTTETESLRQYGILLDQTGKKAVLESNGIRMEVDKNINAVRAGIIELMGRAFGGSMQDAKDTFSGTLDTMSGMWTDFQQDIMGEGKNSGPFETLKSTLHEIRDEWEAFTQSQDYKVLVREIQDTLVSGIELARDGVVKLGDAFLLAKDNADVLKGIVAALVTYKITLGLADLIGNLKEAIKLTKEALALTRGLAAAQATTPVGLVAAGVGAVAGLAVYGRAAVKMKDAEKQAERTKKAIEELDEQLKGAGQDKIKQSYLDVAANIKTTEQNIASMTERLKEMREIATHPTDGLFGKGYGERERVTLTDIKKLMGEIDAEQEKLRILRESEKHLGGMIQASDSKPTNNGGTSTKSSATSTSTKSAAELLVENIRAQIKYLYADGESFIPILDQWIARSQTLGKDWRALKDLKQEIVDTATERNPFSPENMLESMKETQSRMAALREESAKLRQAEDDNYAWQNDAGLMSDGEYLNKVTANFERLKAEFASTGAAAENFLLWPEELRSVFSTLQSAILQNAEPAIEALKKQLDEGKLSVDEYKRAAQELVNTLTAQGLTQGNAETLLKQLTSDAESAKRQIIDLNELTKTWVEDFQSGIADAIVEGEGFADTLTSIGKEMEKVALKLILFGKNGQGGLFGGLFSGLFGGFHSGGIVGGSPTFRRMVRIPKFHSGGIIGRDERLIIAQRGEGVFTREQMKALGGGGGSQVFAPNVSVTVNNSGGGDMSDEQAQKLGQAVNDQIRIQVAEEIYKYQRAGVFRNAFAR